MMLLQHPLFLSFFPLLFLTVLLYKWISSQNTSGKNLPPSPPRIPVIGNLHQVSLYPHLSLASLAQKHGPLMLLYFGSVPVLVASSADAAKEIMKTQDLAFSDRPDSSIWSRIFYNGKDVAFAPYSEYWRQVKSTCVLQLLSNKRVQSFHKVREEEVALMIKKIEDCGSKPVDLSELIVRLTSDVISRIALGKKYSIKSGGEGDSFKELFGEIAELIGNFSVGDYIPWLYWVDILSGLKGKVERSAKEVDVFLEGVISDHMTALDSGTANQDFVYILLDIQKQNNKNNGFSIDKGSVKGAILNMFFDGTDTTAAALEWAMTNLIKNPTVMSKLQKEVREIGRGKPSISEDDLEKMHYLKAVMKESMRINIPVPLLVPREARQDAKVMGYDIKSGTQVLINAWVIARDPSLWDNPEEFRPERFLNSPIDHKGLHFEFLPFGAGRRGCPGIQYAMAINELAVANIVHKFDFALPNGERMEDLDMTGTTGMTVHKKSPLLVIATPHI